MKTTKCKQCGKVIEGYSEKQVNYMMEQHMLKHKYENVKEDKKNAINK